MKVRLGLVGSLCCAVMFTVGAARSPVTTTRPRTDIPVATLELPTRTVTAGTVTQVKLRIDNATGSPIPFSGCGGPNIAAYLVNDAVRQEPDVFPKCLNMFTLPVGRSTFPLAIATYCSEDFDPQSPMRQCSAFGGSPPLPAGDYQLAVYVAGSLDLELPKPITVHVSAPQAERPSGRATARLELTTPIITANRVVDAAVVVDNGTGDRLELIGCGSPFYVDLSNGTTKQGTSTLTCRQPFSLPVGESHQKVSIATFYGGCSPDPNQAAPELGFPQCLPGGSNQPRGGIPPLPVGRYRAKVFGNENVVELAKPPTVYVVAEECATDVMTVQVPSVVGKRLGAARRIVEETGLKVVDLETHESAGAPNSATVAAQVPKAGTIVSRGSCMGLRPR